MRKRLLLKGGFLILVMFLILFVCFVLNYEKEINENIDDKNEVNR